MNPYQQTIHLLAQRGLPERVIGQNTIAYFLAVEKKTPQQVVEILCGRARQSGQVVERVIRWTETA